jgi:hypothetical protein
MRFSEEPRNAVMDLSATVKTHEEFALAVARDSSLAERQASLLLVGGNSPRHEVIRRAQAVLRTDWLASYWSHAAVILEWGNDLSTALGAEVALEPWRADLQVPERNGVTLFPLQRYLDERAYPNLAVATVSLPSARGRTKKATATARPRVDYKQAIVEAVRNPNRDRVRYRFLEWLAAWSAYTYQPHGQANPLLQDIPLPAAALCEYAYEAGSMDLTPGATAPNACPEILWSTLLYWHTRMGEHIASVRIWCVLRDPTCAARTPLAMSLEETLS